LLGRRLRARADKTPLEFVYISERLVDDVYKRYLAGKRGAKLEGLSIAGNSAQGRIATSQPENVYWLARKATELVKKRTGSLLDEKPYIRVDGVPTTWATVPFMQEQGRVAWFEAEADTREGSVLLILCGSVRNLRGHVPTARPSGWYPSTAEGLSQIVRAFAHGNNDPRPSLRAKTDEVASFVQTAHGIGEKIAENCKIGDENLDLLFNVFYVCDDLALDGREFRRAFLGTPLWAARRAPVDIADDPREPYRGQHVETHDEDRASPTDRTGTSRLAAPESTAEGLLLADPPVSTSFEVAITLYRGYEFGMPLDELDPDAAMGTMTRGGFTATCIPRVGEHLCGLGPWSDQRARTTVPTPTLEIRSVVYTTGPPAEESECHITVHASAPWRQDLDRAAFIKQFTDRGWQWHSADPADWGIGLASNPPMHILGGPEKGTGQDT
jgi:hypothetical protein